MHHKNILLIARTTRYHDRMRELSHKLDVSIALATPATFSQAISSGHDFSLVIVDPEGMERDTLNAVARCCCGLARRMRQTTSSPWTI